MLDVGRWMLNADVAIPSGLWHHRHRSGQPWRNTVVRIPGPSWIVKRRISKIAPEEEAMGG